jgi:hypothetical protein
MNKDRTRTDSDTYLTQAGSLAVLQRDLLRRRPFMPTAAHGIASNLIEQARNAIRHPADAARLKPWMAYQATRLRAALQGE